MRKLGLILLLALVAGCVTPDARREGWTPDPVNAAATSPTWDFVVHLIYALGVWLGPKT